MSTFLFDDYTPQDARPVEGAPSSAGEIISAAFEAQKITDNTFAKRAALNEAFTARIDLVKKLTGVQLENPLYGNPTDPEWERNPTAYLARKREKFDADLRNIADAQNDEVRDLLAGKTVEREAYDLALKAEGRYEDAYARGPDYLRGIYSLTGGFGGALYDPVTYLPFGAGRVVGGTVTTRIARQAFLQGSINAGLTAAVQPLVQSWRAEAGLEAGFGKAVENTAYAFVFGAGLGGASQGLSEAVSGFRAWRAKKRGEPIESQPTEPGALAEAVIAEMPDDVRGAYHAYARAKEIEASAPAGTDPGDWARMIDMGERHLADPARNPPPVLVESEPSLFGDLPQAPAQGFRVGETFVTQGHKASFIEIPASQVDFEASVMQFRPKSNAKGATDRLASVTKWDPAAADDLVFYQYRDGRIVVVDGHQRSNFAQRLEGEGHPPITLKGFLFKEEDGATPGFMRAYGAKRNLQRESVRDPVDAAIAIREAEWMLKDGSVALGGPTIVAGKNLAKLSPEAFGMVQGGALDAHLAQAIGEYAGARPELHRFLATELAKADIRNIDEARQFIAEAVRAGVKNAELGAQSTLFGTDAFAKTIMVERAQVSAAAMKQLAADKRFFGVLAAEVDRARGTKNVLDTAGNEAREQAARELLSVIGQLARMVGPVSDLLEKHAQAFAEAGGKRGRIGAHAKGFVDDVLDLFQREGLDGVMRATETAPLPHPARPFEPGSPEAKARAEAVELVPEKPKDGEAPDAPPDLFGGPARFDEATGEIRSSSWAEEAKALDRSDHIAMAVDACRSRT